ncbi:chromogranin A, isoform CRA_b [Mus musculus]|nr:chromogranin A, isoform CRA_b [Mus musculus]
MRSTAVLALLLCAGQVFALPVNSPMTKGDTKVMKCVLEVISDSLSKPSPMPVSPECLETLQGDERILSILRHQNLLKELQDLALQGAKERAQQPLKQQQPPKQQQQQQQQQQEWEDKRWSRMDQLAKELTAEKRLEGEDDPDRSMKLSFRTRAYGFRDPGPQLRRGWRPSSREDSVEARSDFEEKKEEEGRPGAREPVSHRGRAGEGGPPAAGFAAGMRPWLVGPAMASRPDCCSSRAASSHRAQVTPFAPHLLLFSAPALDTSAGQP